jgi:hypothetical protein
VIERVPKLSSFMDFLIATGLRYSEALNLYNHLKKMVDKDRLTEYYRNCILVHYRYPDIFIRRKKKVFISIAPDTLIKKIVDSDILITKLK